MEASHTTVNVGGGAGTGTVCGGPPPAGSGQRVWPNGSERLLSVTEAPGRLQLGIGGERRVPECLFFFSKGTDGLVGHWRADVLRFVPIASCAHVRWHRLRRGGGGWGGSEAEGEGCVPKMDLQFRSRLIGSIVFPTKHFLVWVGGRGSGGGAQAAIPPPPPPPPVTSLGLTRASSLAAGPVVEDEGSAGGLGVGWRSTTTAHHIPWTPERGLAEGGRDFWVPDRHGDGFATSAPRARRRGADPGPRRDGRRDHGTNERGVAVPRVCICCGQYLLEA